MHGQSCDDQREPNSDPCCSVNSNANTVSSGTVLAFFWVQVEVIELLPAASSFMH